MFFPKIGQLNDKAQKAAELLELGEETLFHLVTNNSNNNSEKKYTTFCRNVLGRVLNYSASLIPEITSSPQDIDDAIGFANKCACLVVQRPGTSPLTPQLLN